MTARSTEEGLLERCSAVARGLADFAVDPREANVFRVAAMVVGQPFRAEARRLLRVSDAFFATHPSEQLPPDAVVRNGWVSTLPRLREQLTATLSR